VDKGGDYAPLAPLINDKVKAMVLIGEASGKMKQALGSYTETHEARSLDEAVRTASALAASGDTVLLCPACSSFDMFKNFEDRGDAFAQAVKGLGGKG
jgi:UDP-N-acetylmuramoylalanine--D-glutamate ligase